MLLAVLVEPLVEQVVLLVEQVALLVVALVPGFSVSECAVVSVEGTRGEPLLVVVVEERFPPSCFLREQPTSVRFIRAIDRASSKMPILFCFILYHTFEIFAF